MQAKEKQKYLAKVQAEISHLHNCGAMHRETVAVHETASGKTLWHGEVEVFDLHGHELTKRCYAWGRLEAASYERTRFFAILEIPPVNSPATAVRFALSLQPSTRSRIPGIVKPYETA